ncbi:unnamed protein product [Amoebophrya sp. A25]|nr:unnamed protein product [Amoebophrya sp. A25]|eukprot:GSA25T00017782001.1
MNKQANVFLLSYAFNQDYTCFICGTTQGFRVYTINPLAEVHRRETAANNACALVSMLYKTNIFPLVRALDPASNRVQIWDDNKQQMVGELSNRHDVKGVVLRRDVIAMVCEYSVYLYTTDVLRLILHVATSCNLRGLCALSPKEKTWVLCCPGQTAGTIRVQHGQVEEQQLISCANQTSHVFTAHQSSLAALSVNQTGTLVASASEQGTVVRVFQTSNGQVLHELRRGSSPCLISCITFRADDKYLAVASNSPTVHIFRLDEQQESVSTCENGGGEGQPVRQPSEQIGGARSSASPPGAAGESVKDQIGQLFNTGKERIKELTAQAVSTAVDQLNNTSELKETWKNAVPRYFLASRSYAQFRVPDMASNEDPYQDRQRYPDFRAQQSGIRGALVCFGPPEKESFFVLHYNGFIYEVALTGKAETQELDPKLNPMSPGGDIKTPGAATAGAPATRARTTRASSLASAQLPADAGAAMKELMPGVNVGTRLVQAQTWFASRPDFQMHKQIIGADDDSDWQLI